MKLYHYPNCSTCRKARTFLSKIEAQVELINLAEQAPSVTELRFILECYEGQIKKLFNTSGVQYRELNMKTRLPELSAEQALELLASNGLLVKRPFLLTQNTAQPKGLVGFNEQQWSDVLL